MGEQSARFAFMYVPSAFKYAAGLDMVQHIVDESQSTSRAALGIR